MIKKKTTSRTSVSLVWSIVIIQLILVFFVPDAYAQEEVQKSWWQEMWSKTFIYPILLMFLFTMITYFLSLIRKDKLLKKLRDKYVVFDMGDGKRIGGIMRWELSGMEIISEESRKRGGAPSFVFNENERGQIKAYIRYLDAMTERERVERDVELEHVYHPSFPTIVVRKIRNFFVALKSALNKTVEQIWGQVQKTRFYGMMRQYGAKEQVEEIQKESWQQASEESYERLIERFVGSKIKVKAHNDDYIGVLKDYTKEHLHLMDVKRPNGEGYKDEWGPIEIDIEHGKRETSDDRGMHLRIEGDTLIVENHESYPVQIHGIRYKGDPGEQFHDWKWNKKIEAFGETRIQMRPNPKNVNVGPLVRVVTRQSLHWRNFKRVGLKFRSFRFADITFPRKFCHITETAEKYQPELLSISKIMEGALDEKEERSEEFLITDKEGKPIKGLSIVHGYVTNINEDRIDIKSVDQLYGRRWSVRHAFDVLDNKLRPIKPHVTFNPIYRSLIAKQTALVKKIGQVEQAKKPIAPILYSPARLNIQLPEKKKPVLPVKILALMGNITDVEFPILKQYNKIRDHRLIFDRTKDVCLPDIEKNHMIWIGQGELFNEEYRMSIDGEKRIKSFASKGGIVIVSGQNVENVKRRNIGWIPERVWLSELDETTEFHPVKFSSDARRMFKNPNEIKSGEVKLDDSWTGWSDKFEVLATMNGGGEAAVLLLEYGKGIYIITGFKNQNKEDVQINTKVMENLLHYSVRWFDKQEHDRLYYV